MDWLLVEKEQLSILSYALVSLRWMWIGSLLWLGEACPDILCWAGRAVTGQHESIHCYCSEAHSNPCWVQLLHIFQMVIANHVIFRSLELFASLNWAGAKNPIKQKQNYWPGKLLSAAQGSLPWGSDGKSPTQFLSLVSRTWRCCSWRPSGNLWRSLSS